jgi:FKBP-type peptidyl-prolyl cis-trans isomerase SlyD
MQIGLHSVVTLSYSLSARKGDMDIPTFIEETSDAHPFVFLFGGGGLIKGFEENLAGKRAGDDFEFWVSPADGYGETDEEAVFDVPVGTFADESGRVDHSRIVKGGSVQMQDEHGHVHSGTIVDVGAEHVSLDFNHPMAGQHLRFKGKVKDVRPATAEEIAHGHVHGPGGHHH